MPNQDLTTVTGCLNAGNYSQAVAVAGVTMNGNQQILDAINACQVAANAEAAAVVVALGIAAGN